MMLVMNWCARILNIARLRTTKIVWNFHCKSTKRYATSTVFALSSGMGKCGVAVIRVSGPKAKHSLLQICGEITKPRVASVRKLMNPNSKEVLDKSLVLWFPGPHSFTGEDCGEFHVHGGPAVIASVLCALGTIDGLRPAQAGDFTKQAFINGKLDLTEVEGLGDLIHAETEAQRKQALRQMEGELGTMYSHWRTRLIKCLANTEAFIDFHEEENIEDDILDSVSTEVSRLQKEVSDHLNDGRRGERLRDGLRVVILGEPNVGKSSLLNAICQRPAAIVSPIAGTTRDVVETALNIGGYPVLLSDTAGLRETSDFVEKEGVSRAVSRANSADIKILMLDLERHRKELENMSSLPDFMSSYMHSLGLFQVAGDDVQKTVIHDARPLWSHSNVYSSTVSQSHVNQHNVDFLNDASEQLPVSYKSEQMTKDLEAVDLSNVLLVLNKCDLLQDDSLLYRFHHEEGSMCKISCQTGQGLNTFMELLIGKIQNLCGDPVSGRPSLTQTRHRHHLNRCLQFLNEFSQFVSYDTVLAAERLRMAARELGQVTGAVSAEDVLDVIFADFCIGK